MDGECCYGGIVSYRIFFFFNDTATTEIYTLSLHDALPIYIFDQRYNDILTVKSKNVGWPTRFLFIQVVIERSARKYKNGRNRRSAIRQQCVLEVTTRNKLCCDLATCATHFEKVQWFSQKWFICIRGKNIWFEFCEITKQLMED